MTETPSNNVETEFVPKYYRMNPETDTLVFDGRELKNGMVVLIEECRLRQNIEGIIGASTLDNALKMNRWMTIQNVQIFREPYTRPKVAFVGKYEDGSLRKHDWGISFAWLVKKESLPVVDRPSSFQQVQQMVVDLMINHWGVENPDTELHADETTHMIFEVVSRSYRDTDIALGLTSPEDYAEPGTNLPPANLMSPEVYDEYRWAGNPMFLKPYSEEDARFTEAYRMAVSPYIAIQEDGDLRKASDEEEAAFQKLQLGTFTGGRSSEEDYDDLAFKRRIKNYGLITQYFRKITKED